MRAQKAQSTVEYLLLVTAVIAVAILFTTGSGTGGFQGRLNQVFNETTQDMLNVASRLDTNAVISSTQGTAPSTDSGSSGSSGGSSAGTGSSGSSTGTTGSGSTSTNPECQPGFVGPVEPGTCVDTSGSTSGTTGTPTGTSQVVCDGTVCQDEICNPSGCTVVPSGTGGVTVTTTQI